MSITVMSPSSVGEALHLFSVMNKYEVLCSMEMHISGQADPILGITRQPVKAEYVESFNRVGTGDSVVVTLGESEHCFELNLSVSKHITDCQISLCITSENYAAWFSSEEIPPEGIAEARGYKEDSEDEYSPLFVNSYEQSLVEYIRTLEFDDLLDAQDALIATAQRAQKKAIESVNDQNFSNANGWQSRSIALMKLANLLSESNADYRAHIHPEVNPNE